MSKSVSGRIVFLVIALGSMIMLSLGTTCDSIDVPYEHIALPHLEIGDLLVFESMGAYTSASASNFNGLEKAKIIVVE